MERITIKTIVGEIFTLPYPTEFMPSDTANLVAELTTMNGDVHADANGWRYSDATMSWGYLTEKDLRLLSNACRGGQFELTFMTPNGETTEIVAPLSNVSKRIRSRDADGNPVWLNVGVSIRFPMAHH